MTGGHVAPGAVGRLLNPSLSLQGPRGRHDQPDGPDSPAGSEPARADRGPPVSLFSPCGERGGPGPPSLPTPGPLPLARPLLGFRPVGGQPAPDLRAPVPGPAAAGDWPSCPPSVPRTLGYLWAPCWPGVTVPPPLLLLSRPLRRPGLASSAAPRSSSSGCRCLFLHFFPFFEPIVLSGSLLDLLCGLPSCQVPSHPPPGWPRCPLSGSRRADPGLWSAAASGSCAA